MSGKRVLLKKVLAIVSVPVWLLFAMAMLQTTMHMLDMEPEGTAGYRYGYAFGQVTAALLMGTVLFFWARWILRVLDRTGSSPEGPME